MNFAVSRSATRSAAVSAAIDGYDRACFDSLAEIEEKHFWFRARSRVIETLARQITASLPAGYRVLEVGCGTGNVLRAMERACPAGSVIGLDYYAEGLRYARHRSAARCRASRRPA